MSTSGKRKYGKSLARWAERALWIVLFAWVGHRLTPQVAAWVGFGEPLGPAPALVVETRDDGPIGNAEVNDRVVVVNFWATWCLPCRVEMPSLQKLHERYADRGLLVLGLATDGENDSAMETYLEDMEITFPIGTASPELRAAYGGIDRLPTTILIDRRGRVRHRVEGLMAPPALRAAVLRLLDER
jgi:thiol-disulfide isomerase/thioredoxin